jgi:curved DNA-binding protein CbpA
MNREQALSLLELSGTPGPDEINSAYRAQAKRYHPDGHSDANDDVKKMLAERFNALNEARELLLAQAGASERGRGSQGSTDGDGARKTGGRRGGASGHSFEERAGQVRVLAGRRQWPAMLRLLASMEEVYGDRVELFQLELEVLGAAGEYVLALDAGRNILELAPESRHEPDFLHHLANLALLGNQTRQGLMYINQAEEELAGPVPAFIETRARLNIAMGKTAEADALIERLKQYDPKNPLVLEREEVWNIANTYVDKSDASQSACFLCLLLECIFDCI